MSNISTDTGVPLLERFKLKLGGGKSLWLVLPAFLFFLVFFVIPVVELFSISLNPPSRGSITLEYAFTLKNFIRFFSHKLYYLAAFRSVWIAAVVSVVTMVLAYPLSYVIAKTRSAVVATRLITLVLIAMQLDMVIRVYGIMVLLGDNGLINQILLYYGIISKPLPLMYNSFGVIVGLVQFSLPFMVLSLTSAIKGIHPSLEEAARSLGASRLKAFYKIVLPMSMPGLLAGSLLVFSISISSYVVPALMGGWKVMVMPIHIYQQIAEVGRWQFGAAIGVILFITSLVAVFVYQKYAARMAGGRI